MAEEPLVPSLQGPAAHQMPGPGRLTSRNLPRQALGLLAPRTHAETVPQAPASATAVPLPARSTWMGSASRVESTGSSAHPNHHETRCRTPPALQTGRTLERLAHGAHLRRSPARSTHPLPMRSEAAPCAPFAMHRNCPHQRGGQVQTRQKPGPRPGGNPVQKHHGPGGRRRRH